MRLQVSLKSGVPIYVQVAAQIKQLVASGRLEVGDELPTIRELAEQVLVNPNTVARAYRELEHAGIVASRRGLGTRVTARGIPLGARERARILADRVRTLLMEAAHLGVEYDEIITLMEKHRDIMSPEKKEIVHGR